MIKEVALITISAVLFVQMGLSSAIQGFLHIKSKIASCPKCACFWSVLAYCILTRNGIVTSVAASFISAYSALWLALLYDALAKLYNSAYEAITTDAEAGQDTGQATATDEMS